MLVHITPIPAFIDNYIWAIHNDKYAVVVDPGDAGPVLKFLTQHQLKLSTILITHHHGDHIGGVAELRAKFKVPVYGPRQENIPMLTQQLAEPDQLMLTELGLRLSVIDVPGHTAGHIAYYGNDMVFCGDTLFACGCGRLFEGTPMQMLASLNKLAVLPKTTKVYCAHEYTLANLRFALAVEPHSLAIKEREEKERQKRASNLPTLPSTIGLELTTNPFLRSNVTEVIEAANKYADKYLNNELDVFTAIRQWKNQF